MKITREKVCHCALNRIFGFEPKIALALMENLGGAAEIFDLGKDEIDQLLGPHSKYKGRICKRAEDEAYEELEKLSKAGIRFTGWGEEDFPLLLKECEDAPAGIYIRSDTPDTTLWSKDRYISVVGTRDLSSYGREWCVRIIDSLAQSKEKPCIVSGLAIGTDICAHRAALEAGLPTIAVLPNGPDSTYPLRHTDFAERLRHTPECALITDYPPGTAPLAVHFLRRNRLIAGLSQATLLIESKIKGGGMMTCNLAFSYGRDVYALPGRIDDTCSQGCNHLIRSKVAEPIFNMKELIKGLSLNTLGSQKEITDNERIVMAYGTSLTSDKIEILSKILLLIRKHRGITVEEIAAALSVGYSDAVRMTSLLESDGFINTDLLQRCCINVRK